MQFIKFGFGNYERCFRHIQNKYISRDEAIKLVKKYDGEFPSDISENALTIWNLLKMNFIKLLIYIVIVKFGIKRKITGN